MNERGDGTAEERKKREEAEDAGQNAELVKKCKENDEYTTYQCQYVSGAGKGRSHLRINLQSW